MYHFLDFYWFVAATLPDTIPGKGSADGIEHLFFVGAPQRGQKIFLRPIPGEAMDHHIGWQNSQAGLQNADIVLLGEDGHLARPGILGPGLRPPAHEEAEA